MARFTEDELRAAIKNPALVTFAYESGVCTGMKVLGATSFRADRARVVAAGQSPSAAAAERC
ncbi:hypothetical protein L2216_25660, partial [Xanthomonas perforans]|nr:hypothetical protein [Xanthomonas perforans]